MKTKAVYAGSFDPVHFGHIDVIRRASRDFSLTVLVANNPTKKYMFSLQERVKMLQAVTSLSTMNGTFVKVVALEDPTKLTADWAFENNIPVIIRGVRSFTDYDMESMIRDVNISQQNGIETYFLKADQKQSHFSSGAVKELFNHAGFIHEYVPLLVKREIEKKNNLHIIGVTGNIASGKNWVCEKLMQEDGVYHLDMDKLAHSILFESQLPVHLEVRRTIRSTFGLSPFGEADRTDVLNSEERSQLGNLVFSNGALREKLNDIMRPLILTMMRQVLSSKKGIVLLNSALLAEFNLSYMCNNMVVLVTTDEITRQKRLINRGLTNAQIKHRLDSQYTDDRKRSHLKQAIERDNFGKIIEVDNSHGNPSACDGLYEKIQKELGLK